MKNIKVVFAGLLACTLVAVGCGSNNKRSSSINIDSSSNALLSSSFVGPSMSAFSFNRSSSEQSALSFTPHISSSTHQLENWILITYSQFRTAYNSRPACPWNHVKFQYGDESQFNGERTKIDIELTLSNGEENLVDGQWVVDQNKTDAGLGDITQAMIPTDQSIAQFENPPKGYTVVYKREALSNRYHMHVDINTETRNATIDAYYDKYFYVTDLLQTSNGFEIQKCIANWATK